MDTATAAWGRSGLAALTGHADGPPDFSRAAVLAHAQGMADAYRDRTGGALDAATLLAGRAGLLGLTRQGRTSAGGATKLFEARDAWCALTLSREDDVAAVPALVEAAEAPDPWMSVLEWARGRPAAEVVDRARLLGLPAARLGECHASPQVTRDIGARAGPRRPADLLVVDLSAMWAGPLCGQLLGRAGATVVKVETRSRPDGTRSGNRAFFDWMNAGKLCYAADFDAPARLRALLEVADVVVEGSRPQALRRRGLGPDDVVGRPGRVWLRVTGHGAEAERAGHVAFGDDAAVAGGLVGAASDGPVFCADAIADPLTGLHATLAVLTALERGGGVVIDVAMAGMAAEYARLACAPSAGTAEVRAPEPPPRSAPASALGADNRRVDLLIEERLGSC